MEIHEIQYQKTWDDFVRAQSDYTFLDSWAWGSFNEASGSKVWRLGMFENGSLEGVALVILVAARRGRFLFVPHGPIFAQSKNVETPNHKLQIPNNIKIQNSKLETFVDYFKNIALKEVCAFIRISPLLLKEPENKKAFLDFGFRKAPMHMHAETTWILDTAVSEDQLLAGMRKTTRYLVRRGERDGVEVTSGNNADLIREFYDLYKHTAARQHFAPFSFDYIAREAAVFGDEGARIYLAKHEGRVLAGALIVFYGERAFYHHGASIHHPTASYFLQWRIIQECRACGLREYNFWGIDFRPRHPWAGVTLFKTGFGGVARAYMSAEDLPIRFSYWASFVIETLRRIRRRY